MFQKICCRGGDVGECFSNGFIESYKRHAKMLSQDDKLSIVGADAIVECSFQNQVRRNSILSISPEKFCFFHCYLSLL